MTVSFRARQFTYALLAMAALLALVMAVGWRTLVAVEQEELDARLCLEARRLLGPSRPGEDLERLQADVALKLRVQRPEHVQLQALADNGSLREQSAAWPAGLVQPALVWHPVAARANAPAPRGEAARAECMVTTASQGDRQWRLGRLSDPRGTGLVAADLADIGAELGGALARALLIVAPLALALSALGAWLLASLAMRPLRRLREAMRTLTPQQLDQRLNTAGEDREFAHLIAAYNLMLERLETSFRQAARFSADAAHELRTPLTILRGRLEQAARDAGSEAQQVALLGMLDEVGRLAEIVRKLLLLSQADAGRLAVQRQAVDFSGLLAELLADAPLLLQHQRLQTDIASGLVVQGDAVLLRQLLNNLLGNAARHGRPDGRIEVQARPVGDHLELRITNDCMPLGAEARRHLFERFYRADSARDRRVGGSGLGLSLAREIARAHGGDVVLEPSPDDVVCLCTRLALG